MDRNQVFALAAIFQSASLVHRLAESGTSDPRARNPLIHSIFQTAPENLADVYDGEQNLAPGLTLLAKGVQAAPPQVRLYFAGIIALERSLSRSSETLTHLAAGIENSATRLDHFELDHENILASLADLYTQTLSLLTPRIMIRGDQNLLSQDRIVNEVRTLLLAGVRAAMLWRQYGGNRWRLLFGGAKIRTTAQSLLLELGA